MADISKIQLENVTYDIKDETARNDISSLNTNLNNEKNTRIANEQTITNLVIISDSYGVMDGITNYPNYIKSYLNLDNDHFYNNSYGGTGFAHPNDNKTFYTLVEECITNLTEERRNNVSHVLLAGGYNDQWSSESDIQTGVENTINLAHTTFPNAKIYIGHIGWSRNNSDLYHAFKNYYEATSKSKYGKFIINSQNILRGDLISVDNVHPNIEGLETLAKNLITGLQNGVCYPLSPFKYLKDTDNNNLGVVSQQNDIINFELYDFEFVSSGTANGDTTQFKTLTSDSMISGHSNCKFKVPCYFINNTTYQYVVGYCNWLISQGVITIQPIALKSDGTNFFDYTSIRFQGAMIPISHVFS